MSTPLRWLPLITVYLPASHSPAYPSMPPRSSPRWTLVQPAIIADTGVAAQLPPVLLTTTSVAPYSAVEAALIPYIGQHPSLAKAAPKLKTLNLNADFQISIMDYAIMAAHDSTVAALFRTHQMTPAQFAATQVAVFSAIGAAMGQERVDSATIAGKNVAFVQAHRSAVATDWRLVQFSMQTAQDVKMQIQQRMH